VTLVREGGTTGQVTLAVLVTSGSSTDYNVAAFPYLFDGMQYQLVTFAQGTKSVPLPVTIRTAAKIGDTISLELIPTTTSNGATVDAERSTATISIIAPN
jgi:hypothetical protein